MHILIIPSEEFVPVYNKLDGIFQYHQASILKEAGYKVGALSVRLSYSVPMIFKGLLFKATGGKAGNATDNFSFPDLLKLGLDKFFNAHKFVTIELIDGIPVCRVDGLYFRQPANNRNHFSWVKAGMTCFSEYLKQYGRPDIIHAHDAIYAGMLAAKIHEKFGLAYIITEHSSTYALKKADAEIVNHVKKAHKNAVALYAVSETFANLLNKLFSFDRFQYLPNVLDQYLEQSIVATIASRLKFQSNKFIFLHIAVFKPVKDQLTLIRAFSKVVQHNTNVQLCIGGIGELQNELMALVEKLNLSENVKFLGLLNRDEVIKYLQQCDCFVLSSKYETFGVVTIEAMLFGKPVIVTRCGIAETIVNEKTGIIVETENEQQLADAMLKMASTSKEYDGPAIRQFAIDNFGKESFLKKIKKIYSELT